MLLVRLRLLLILVFIFVKFKLFKFLDKVILLLIILLFLLENIELGVFRIFEFIVIFFKVFKLI